MAHSAHALWRVCEEASALKNHHDGRTSATSRASGGGSCWGERRFWFRCRVGNCTEWPRIQQISFRCRACNCTDSPRIRKIEYYQLGTRSCKDAESVYCGAVPWCHQSDEGMPFLWPRHNILSFSWPWPGWSNISYASNTWGPRIGNRSREPQSTGKTADSRQDRSDARGWSIESRATEEVQTRQKPKGRQEKTVWRTSSSRTPEDGKQQQEDKADAIR